MFDYSENNLFDRCGAIDVPYDPNKKPEFTGKYVVIDGQEIPIINFKFQSGVRFTRYICLRTFLGYIPINRVNKFKDIFDKTKYLTDETEWLVRYSSKNATNEEKNQVKQLSLSLGRHWKS